MAQHPNQQQRLYLSDQPEIIVNASNQLTRAEKVYLFTRLSAAAFAALSLLTLAAGIGYGVGVAEGQRVAIGKACEGGTDE